MTKFDICLMNPPYDKNLHLKFLEKSFGLLTADGTLVYIGPDDWIVNEFGYAQKSKYRNTIKDEYCKYIDEIETFTYEEFNSFFNTKWGKGASIFKMKHNAKGINPEVFEIDNVILKKIIQKTQSELSSLRSHFIRKTDKKWFAAVRRTNHFYLNWVEKDNTKISAKDGILFDSENEMNNFINSFDTWFYRYLNCTGWSGSENSADVPYLGDYSKPWTDERLYELFELTKEEQENIKQEIKEKSKW